MYFPYLVSILLPELGYPTVKGRGWGGREAGPDWVLTATGAAGPAGKLRLAVKLFIWMCCAAAGGHEPKKIVSYVTFT